MTTTTLRSDLESVRNELEQAQSAAEEIRINMVRLSHFVGITQKAHSFNPSELAENISLAMGEFARGLRSTLRLVRAMQDKERDSSSRLANAGPKCLVCGHYHGGQGGCVTAHALVPREQCPTCQKG